MVLSTRAILVLLHVLCAAFLLGSSLFALFVRSEVRRAATLGELRRWLGFFHASARFNPVAALGVLATGLYLAWGWIFQAPWIVVALGAYVFSLVLAARLVPSVARRLAEASTGHDDAAAITPAIDALRWSRHWDVTAALLLGNDIASFYLMLGKPALAESLGALLLVDLGALALFALLARRPDTATAAPVSAPTPLVAPPG